jgi:hypothetical protein
VKPSLAAQWAALDDHFRQHATLVDRFRHVGPDAVVRMWKCQSNEHGAGVPRTRKRPPEAWIAGPAIFAYAVNASDRLSQCERDALTERHCELFGTWPD